MGWLSNNWGNVLSAAGLIAGVASFFQSQEAAKKADEAARQSANAAEATSEAVRQAKEAAAEATVLSQFLTAHQLGSEIETLMDAVAYPAALVRCRDLGKHLGYVIKRWDHVVPTSTLVSLVAAHSQIEQMVDKLQRNATVGKIEHARLLNLVRSVSKSLSEEHALAEKRAQ